MERTIKKIEEYKKEAGEIVEVNLKKILEEGKAKPEIVSIVLGLNGCVNRRRP